MLLNFNVYNSLILAGVIQGLIFGAVVLLSKKYKHKSVYFLTAIIIIYSLSNLQFYLQDINLISYTELFDNYFVPWGNAIPALLYLYVVSFLDPQRQIARNEKLLFIPFLFSLAISIFYKLIKWLELNEELLSGVMLYMETYDELISALFHIIIIVVLLVKIKNYKRAHGDFKYDHIKLHLNWLRNTLIIFLVLIPMWVSLTGLYMLYPGQISFYPLWIAMALLIYWLGHIGIYKYGIVEQRKQIRSKQLIIEKSIQIKGKTKHIIIERLRTFLDDERRFLDADLNLEKTAQALEISQGHLSKIINTELGTGFKDYINSLRVEEAKSYLLDSDFSNYTLVAIGLEAGFNSKSAFNASFKRITGETPSQYKKSHIN